MAPKTIWKCLFNMLRRLSKDDFNRFCGQLIDRRSELRDRIEGKSFPDVADVLVSTFTETEAVQVAVELLKRIGCNSDVEQLLMEVDGLSSNAGASVTAGPSAVASGGNALTGDEHFVDKYRLELTSRTTNISPILDELLHRGVIQHEAYSAIRCLPTNEDKMRELYSGCLRAGTDCKDIFYQILEKHEKFLIQDLKKNK